MTCEIVATFDGQACPDDTIDRIKRHVDTLERQAGELSVCRVMIDKRRRQQAACVCAAVEVRPCGHLEFLPIAYAVENGVEAALDAAFAAAADSARRLSEPRLETAPPAPGHIIELSSSGRNGVLELEDGRKLGFAVLAEEPAEGVALHVGDHAWVDTNAHEGHANLLVCTHRGLMRSVRLQTL